MKQTFKKSVVFVLILLALTISAVGVTPAYAAGGATLAVTVVGSGSVVSSPAGIACGNIGNTCSFVFAVGTVVTLNATAGSMPFGNWSGGCSGTNVSCMIPMTTDQSVTATFGSGNTSTLSVSKIGTGVGTVTSSPVGIACGATCSFAFNTGTVVTLTAAPDPGVAFNGWVGGGCSGTGTCVVTMSAAQSVAATFGSVTFSDVAATHWAYPYIERLYDAGVTSGCSTTPLNYCPNSNATRAEMAVFILRSEHGKTYTPPPATGLVFTDVPLGSFAAAWIEQLKLEGITSGCGTNIYCPNSPITRAEMAVFLLRGKHGSTYTPPTATGTVFTDVPLGSFAAAWIEQLKTEGITLGCGGGNYCPSNSITRAEMAVFLVKTFSLP